MEYYIGNMAFDANYLEHHGILGQKWGKRNGPPYPLGSGDHSVSEQKAGWRRSLGSNSNSGVRKRSPVKNVVSKNEKPRHSGVNKKAKSTNTEHRYSDVIKESQDRINEIKSNKEKSSTMKSIYGKAWDLSDKDFKSFFGQSKEDAISHEIESLSWRERVNKKAEEDRAAGRMTDTQKVLIGAACVAGAIALGKFAYPIAKDRYLAYVNAGKNTVNINTFLARYGFGQQTRMFNAISEEAFNNMGTTELHLGEGTVVNRVTKSLGPVFHKDNTYVSLTQDDVERYKAVLPRLFWKGWNGELPDKGYVNHYRALSDIVSPSEKQRVQEFINLIKDPNVYNGQSGRDLINQFLDYRDPKKATLSDIFKRGLAALNKEDAFSYSKRSLDRNHKILYDVSKRAGMSDEELGRRVYQLFATLELKNDQSPLTQSYIKRLKTLGYNAIVDDNDRGRLADLPLLIFNAADQLEWSGADQFTVNDVNGLGVRVTELLNRR